MKVSDLNAKTKQLQSMMRPYESSQHAVVAFHLGNEGVAYINSGAPICEDPCEEWIFEIASVTKVFAAILLRVLVEEGKIDPRAALRDMSDALKDVPDWITPERLTSHTSGLPNYFMPLWKVLFRQQPDGPYAKFSRSDLLEWLHNRRNKATPHTHRHALFEPWRRAVG